MILELGKASKSSIMASKSASKQRKSTSNTQKSTNSSSSPATFSSSKNQFENEDQNSTTPTSSSRTRNSERSKENVTVTVRFRPLNPKEIRQGEEVAWYADGDTIVRNEFNSSIAFAYDRVFGPTTTTRHVYDVAAQEVVTGAMEGINGTIFAYGVTSSGKTHTMHGDQRSPGIIPLAVKDAFSIIQETPSREFLLRVSYLEIYNEVVNDLLNPEGQNLRIREDIQGTFVEGIKEEVVLSPAHALSLIAAGEAHRHVGCTNFNLLSSRSHTLFTLTIESSPYGDNPEGEAVNLSQLNLIDLAGSESSRVETTGIRRKEGSYINKSLLTLGTVISKLTDGRSNHIPYRDSKLTRLLQSSLSGHGRVSLICNVTPSSSNSEETHNTLKFAHRAKHIEIQAAHNKIIDEKSLIKKYQSEISSLKEELEQLKRGIISAPPLKPVSEDNHVVVKQKAEASQVKLQSRLEEEEDAKAALLGRIQRLTKLILVSTKATQSSRFPQRPGGRRRHSFGEEELAYLPHKKRDLILDEENMDLYVSLEGNGEMLDDGFKEEKKGRKHGLLNWFKSKKRDSGSTTLTTIDYDKSSGTKSITSPSTPQAESINCPTEARISNSLLTDSIPSADNLLDVVGHDGEVHGDDFSARELSSESLKMDDQTELLREQHKLLSEEVALHTSSLKRLSEESAQNPENERIHVEIRMLNNEMKRKNQQIASLEKQIGVASPASCNNIDTSQMQSFSELIAQLNEKSFELEVKTADNRIISEQLNQKVSELGELEVTVALLREQLSSTSGGRSVDGESFFTGGKNDDSEKLILQQEAQIEELERNVNQLTVAKEQLESRNQKLAEESSYAKGLASAAAVELKALSEEVAKLMNKNERLTADLAASPKQHSPGQRRLSGGGPRNGSKKDVNTAQVDMKRELTLSKEREQSFEAELLEKERREGELLKKVEESKQREAYLENELANMWVLVAKLKKSHGSGSNDDNDSRSDGQNSFS